MPAPVILLVAVMVPVAALACLIIVPVLISSVGVLVLDKVRLGGQGGGVTITENCGLVITQGATVQTKV